MDDVRGISPCEESHGEERDIGARRSRSRVLPLGGHAVRTPLRRSRRSGSRERRPGCSRTSRSRSPADTREVHRRERSRSRSRRHSDRQTSRSLSPVSECSQHSVILGGQASRRCSRRHGAYYQRRSQSRSPPRDGTYGSRRNAATCQVENNLRPNNVGESFSDNNVNMSQLLQVLKSIRGEDPMHKLGNLNNTVPEFDPSKKEQTMTMWLHKVNECASIYGWTGKQTIHFSLSKLRGVAQRWYEGLPSVLFTWEEWQNKLRTAFPSNENYGQMLSDMLFKRARFGDCLENYYYEKIVLINRCGIVGTKAVDCVLHGIDDRSVRLGAEAVQFVDPDKLLTYLRNSKNVKPSDRRTNTSTTTSSKNISKQDSQPRVLNKNQLCFNCKKEGHHIQQCPLPIKRCTRCNRFGHETEQCFTKLTGAEKRVMRVSSLRKTNEKYFKVAIINNIPFESYVDLGSECSMMRLTEFKKLGIGYEKDNSVLVGFGNSTVLSLGKQSVSISIDNVVANVEIVIVADNVMQVPVMIGHTFTEQSHIEIHKSKDNLEIKDLGDIICEKNKIDLYCKSDTTVSGITVVDVYTEPSYNGAIFIDGGFRIEADSMFTVLRGLFRIQEGKGEIVLNSWGVVPITLHKDKLIARGRVAREDHQLQVHTVSCLDPISSLNVNTGSDLSPVEREQLLSLLNRYRGCFAFNLNDLGCTSVGEMTINLDNNEPVVYRPYRLAIKEKEQVRNMVLELLDNAIVRPSTSAYASPIVLVRKKNGELRLCIDYRALNKKTIKENYPMPLIDDQLDILAGHKLYTTLDLKLGYYQIQIREEDRHKTAFVTPDGHFEFNRMPFGLANAPATFQRLMNQILGKARHKEALAYLDDIIIPSKTFSEGISRLESILQLFSQAGLTLNLSKCTFFSPKVDYLGFEISDTGISPGSKKVEAVEKFPTPTNQHNVRQFLGLASFFRRFVPNFSIIAKPLTYLLRKDIKWAWGPDQENSFRKLQSELVRKPTLALYDPNLTTELHTDACKLGVAGILLQRHDSVLKPVAYFSRQTTPEEQNYSSYDLETLAVVLSLHKFRVYLIGIPFKIVTDCNSLRATFQKRDMLPRVARWWEQMQEFNFNIEYRPGKSMSHVDALSRNPVKNVQAEYNVMMINDDNWLATVQGSDDEIQRIIGILKDPNLDNIIDIKTKYKTKNGKLFRITATGDKWVVPKGVRWQIVKQNHDDIGHFAIDKTLNKIESHYWFKRMREFVRKYVSSCLECSYSKSIGGKKPGYLHPIEKADTPFDTIHVDHVGPFIRSNKGNMYILVIVDAYTRYIYLKPVRNTKSSTSIKIFREYFSIFGVPRRLVSDRGTSFTSDIFEKFMTDKGVKHILNAVATPRANGQVERYNKTIIDSLTAKCVGTADNKWDDHLFDVQWGMNNTLNKGINRTPSEVLFGTRLSGSSESKIVSELGDDVTDITDEQGINEIRENVNSHIKLSQEKAKKLYDRKRCKPHVYVVGDLISVERQIPSTGQSRKLVPKYQGPYRITKVYNCDRFQIEDTPLTKKGNKLYSTVVAVDKIKPWLSFNRPHDESSSAESDNTE